MPYTPEYAMRVLRNIYGSYREQMWGPYGPYDAFSIKDEWFDNCYLAIDQLAMGCMVENYRSGLFWKLFMSVPEVREGLERMGVGSLPVSTGFPLAVVPLKKSEGGYAPDALDLCRLPDTGLYTLPFSTEEDGLVFFSFADDLGSVVKRLTLEGRKGENVLQFCSDGLELGRTYRLVLRAGEKNAVLPVRLN